MINNLEELFTEKKFYEIEEKYGYIFEDKELVVKAFTHSSFLSEINQNYERLEFLGDAILQFMISDHLYRFFPNMREGEMSKARSRLVSKPALSYIIRQEKLDKYIIIGKSLSSDVDELSDSYVSDTFEALIAAIYLDSGIKSVSHFLEKTMFKYFDYLLDNEQSKDYKTLLQEKLQVNGTVKISYQTDKKEELFQATVSLSDLVIGSGEGKTKKIAEQAAAQDALAKMVE